MKSNLVIFLLDKEIYGVEVFEKNKFDFININGAHYMNCTGSDSIDSFYTVICEEYSIRDFSSSNMNVALVYDELGNELLYYAINKFQNNGTLQVVPMVELIPVIVSQRSIIKKSGEALLKYRDNYYLVNVAEDGSVQVEKNPEQRENFTSITIADFDFLYYFNMHEFGSDLNQIEMLQNQLMDKEKELASVREELSSLTDLNNIISVRLDNEQGELALSKAKLLEIEKNSKREISQFNYSSKSSRGGLLGNIANGAAAATQSYFISNSKNNRYEFKINLKVQDGASVNAGDLIAKIQYYDSNIREIMDEDITAPIDGRVFYLVSEGKLIQEKEDIAIIGVKNDTRRTALEWYSEMREN